jgi:hypothetical protein
VITKRFAKTFVIVYYTILVQHLQKILAFCKNQVIIFTCKFKFDFLMKFFHFLMQFQDIQ